MYTTLIDSDDLNVILSRSQPAIIDCRFELPDPSAGRQQYLAGHIPSAVYADLESDLSGPVGTGTGRHPLPDADRMREVFSALGIASGRQVIAYDDMAGAFAARLWWMLRYMGHEAVAVLDGGWEHWVKRGFTVETGQVTPRAACFQGRPGSGRLLEIEDVSSVNCLVDSRDPARFRGESEPVDAAAGHIPGAVNYFWQKNLEENGRFRDPDGLKRDLLAVFGNTAAEEAGFYCGSGVTACHNLLAAVHAGLPMPRLYAGSWSQWCADPERPVATGD